MNQRNKIDAHRFQAHQPDSFSISEGVFDYLRNFENERNYNQHFTPAMVKRRNLRLARTAIDVYQRVLRKNGIAF